VELKSSRSWRFLTVSYRNVTGRTYELIKKWERICITHWNNCWETWEWDSHQDSWDLFRLNWTAFELITRMYSSSYSISLDNLFETTEQQTRNYFRQSERLNKLSKRNPRCWLPSPSLRSNFKWYSKWQLLRQNQNKCPRSSRRPHLRKWIIKLPYFW